MTGKEFPECRECQKRPCGSTRCFVTVKGRQCDPSRNGCIQPGDDRFRLPMTAGDGKGGRTQLRYEKPPSPEAILAGWTKHHTAGDGDISPAARPVLLLLRRIVGE
jgi:hypothetical protein